MISRDLRALSLDKVVEMEFRLAGDICGATLVIYYMSSLSMSIFTVKNMPYQMR